MHLGGALLFAAQLGDPSCDGVLGVLPAQAFAQSAGRSVLAAAEGNVVVLGFVDAGVEVFVRGLDGLWASEDFLLVPGLSSLDLCDETLVVGAQASGLISIFTHEAQGWELVQTISDTGLGSALAIHADDLVVGAANFGATGAVHFYRRQSGTFELTQTEIPGALAAGDRFAGTCALADGHAVVGSARKASASFAYWRDGAGVWIETQQFGEGPVAALAMQGERLAIGSSTGLGSVCVYLRDRFSNWNAHAQILGSDPTGSSLFGAALALDFPTLAVGAPGASVHTPEDGAVHLFHATSSGYLQGPSLHRTQSHPLDHLGTALALTATEIVVGAPGIASAVLYASSSSGLDAPLRLAIDPMPPTAGQAFAWRVCGGAPGHSVTLFVSSIGAVPWYLPIGVSGGQLVVQLELARFDALGEWFGTADWPKVGVPLGLQAFAWNPLGWVTSSAPVLLGS